MLSAVGGQEVMMSERCTQVPSAERSKIDTVKRPHLLAQAALSTPKSPNSVAGAICLVPAYSLIAIGRLAACQKPMVDSDDFLSTRDCYTVSPL
jgi:hypothetical protein